MAFCATAPRDRRNFFAAWVPDNRLFAYARRFFTSSFDHASNFRFDFDFAMLPPSEKGTHHNAGTRHFSMGPG
jgi:hypothetical protein